MPIRAVLFDAAGTLIQLRRSVGEIYAEFSERDGVSVPAARIQDAFERVLSGAPPRVFPGHARPEVSSLERQWWQDRVRETFRAADSTAQFRDFNTFFDALYLYFGSNQAWTLRQGAHAGLSGLRDSGLSLGIASNFDDRLPKLLQSLGINEFFHSITTPSECGFAKPDRRFFATALQELGAAADETLYLGDDPDLDLAGAHAAGLHAAPISEIENLTELPTRIEALATLGRVPRN
jgi:putative hydrolase of the HAD superfamily